MLLSANVALQLRLQCCARDLICSLSEWIRASSSAEQHSRTRCPRPAASVAVDVGERMRGVLGDGVFERVERLHASTASSDRYRWMPRGRAMTQACDCLFELLHCAGIVVVGAGTALGHGLIDAPCAAGRCISSASLSTVSLDAARDHRTEAGCMASSSFCNAAQDRRWSRWRCSRSWPDRRAQTSAADFCDNPPARPNRWTGMRDGRAQAPARSARASAERPGSALALICSTRCARFWPPADLQQIFGRLHVAQ